MQSKSDLVFQVFLGVVLLVLVGMGLLGWEPPPVIPEAKPFRDAVLESGYVMFVILIVYFLCGLSFLSNRFVPLASLVLLPVSLNILLFHTLPNPTTQSIIMASVFFLANAYMSYRSRAAYGVLLRAKS